VNKDWKEQICWVRQDSLLYREVQYSPQSMLSPGGCSLSFWGFLKAVAEMKHHSPQKWPWSASWNKSPTCSFLHHNRDTDYFWGTSYAYHWSTYHCWPAWRRGPSTESLIVSWEQKIEMIWRLMSWWIRLPKIGLSYFGRPWHN